MFTIGFLYENSVPVQTQVATAVAQTTAIGSFEGKQAIDFTLQDRNGAEVSLHSYKGKNVVLNFFATWCSPCQEEMPVLVKLDEQLGENSVVLGVNMTSQEKSQQDVQPFLEYFNAKYKVLFDTEGDVLKKYSLIGIPTTFIINKDGIIIKRINGVITEEMLPEIVNLLNYNE